MKRDDWLQLFREHKRKKLFSLPDLVSLTGENKDSVSVQLSRLVKSGLITRVSRGWYENPFSPPSLEETSMVLRRPSYLSMEYALSRYYILSQSTYVLTLVTTRQPYTYKTDRGTCEYHQMDKTLFWGFVKEGPILIGEPEKCLLDLIYIRYVKIGEFKEDAIASLLDDMDMRDIDKKKFNRYLNKYNRPTRRAVSGLLGKFL